MTTSISIEANHDKWMEIRKRMNLDGDDDDANETMIQILLKNWLVLFLELSLVEI